MGYSMAATPVKGSLQGRAGCPPTCFLSARSAKSVGFPRNHPLQQQQQQRGGVFPSLAWSAGGDRWSRRSRAQEPERVVRSCKPLFSDADFVDPQAPTSYIDVLNTSRLLRPPSQQQKLMCEEQELYEKARIQQYARQFVDGIIQYISSEKEYYRFIIIACKENINMIMKMGFISSHNQDEILKGLERIEDDITKGMFEWRENKDIRSNIVETLVERVGEPARKLNAEISQYVQKRTILRLWFHDSADKIVTKIEQLQVELVLLALRNWEFVLPRLMERTDWILLGDLILSKVQLLAKDVSRLRSCKNEIDSKIFINLPLGGTDSCLDSSLSDDCSEKLQNAVVNFGNTIIGDIAINLATLESEINYWISLGFLTSDDKVTESISLLGKHVSDLDKFTGLRRNSLTSYSYSLQDPFQRFLSAYVIAQQILKVATDIAKDASFNHEKVQSFPSFSSVKIKTSRFSGFHKLKHGDPDQSEKKQDAMGIEDFKSRSDETMKKLIDWLIKHQTRENPLKFCK